MICGTAVGTHVRDCFYTRVTKAPPDHFRIGGSAGCRRIALASHGHAAVSLARSADSLTPAAPAVVAVVIQLPQGLRLATG